jgi:beta-lactam-binding protein with PASTA domain
LIGVAAVAAFYIFSTFFHVQQVEVPNVVGMSYTDARSTLISAGIASDKIISNNDPNSSSPVQMHQVESQSPPAGKKASVDSSVTLTVKAGSAQQTMPNLAGQTQNEAESQLENMGVNSGNITVTEHSSNTVPLNEVISTTPAYGSSFTTTSTQIILDVSTGSQSAAVPDVTGKTLTSATAILQADGFTVGHPTSVPSFTVPANQVVSQSPAPGQQAKSGSVVNLTVSSGQPAGTVITHANIDVPLPNGTTLPATVKIDVSDAMGTHTVVDTSQSTPDATYPIVVTTTAKQLGQVNVYVNGQLVITQAVPGSTNSNPSSSGSTNPPGTTGNSNPNTDSGASNQGN